MAQQRKFLITSTHDAPAFDGTTVFSAGWGSPVNNGKYNVVETEDRVGRFKPEILGSTRNQARLMRIYSNGPIVEGDAYSVRSSLSSVHGQPVNVLREAARPLGKSLIDAPPLLVGPTDDLCVAFAGDGTAASLHFIVDDLSEAEWAALSLQALTEGETAETFETRVVAAPATLASWVGTLFVQATSAAAGSIITLPPVADVAIGAKVFIVRELAADTFWFNVDGNGSETINDSTRRVRFPNDGMGVLFIRQGDGWQAVGVADDVTALSVTGSASLSVPTQLRTRIEWNLTGTQNLTLPLLASVAVDQEFEVTITSVTSGSGGAIIPNAGETLDGIVNKRVALVRVGDSALIRRVPSGWMSLTNANDIDLNIQAINADPALAASAGWRGIRAYRCTYAGAGDFTLPTAPLLGTELVVHQTNANTITLQGGPNAIIAGGTAAATKALTADTPLHLKFFTGYWLAV